MGTRHLICVVKDDEYKIAQYGQWDGYPGGQGCGVLEFVSDPDNVFKLKSKLAAVRFLDHDGVDKEFIKDYDKNAPQWSNEPDNRSDEQKRWFSTYITRDLGADILSNVACSEDKEIILLNSLDFAKDSLFCEWAYVIDYDKMAFEVYEGFNKSPLDETERFYFDGACDDGYYPVKLVATFALGNLPSSDEFLATFKEG